MKPKSQGRASRPPAAQPRPRLPAKAAQKLTAGGNPRKEGGFLCRQCGHCCRELSGAFVTCASETDVFRWRLAGRQDILDWVDPIVLGPARVYDIWIDPQTGDDARRCPWLRKARGGARHVCRIHELKPEHCRAYPRSRAHAAKTGCPGFGGAPVRPPGVAGSGGSGGSSRRTRGGLG